MRIVALPVSMATLPGVAVAIASAARQVHFIISITDFGVSDLALRDRDDDGLRAVFRQARVLLERGKNLAVDFRVVLLVLLAIERSLVLAHLVSGNARAFVVDRFLRRRRRGLLAGDAILFGFRDRGLLRFDGRDALALEALTFRLDHAIAFGLRGLGAFRRFAGGGLIGEPHALGLLFGGQALLFRDPRGFGCGARCLFIGRTLRLLAAQLRELRSV